MRWLVFGEAAAMAITTCLHGHNYCLYSNRTCLHPMLFCLHVLRKAPAGVENDKGENDDTGARTSCHSPLLHPLDRAHQQVPRR